jgi:urease accessory protein
MGDPWLIWQLADSAFPIGGFAHSSGLEAAHQLGEIPEANALEIYLGRSIAQVAAATLPFVSGGFQAFADHEDPSVRNAAFIAVDEHQDAFLANHVANRASRALGRGMLATAAASFSPPSTGLGTLDALVRREALPCHQSPAWGAVCAILDVEREECLRLFLFQHLRGCMSSAIRLGIIGPRAAQAMQRRLADTAESWLLRSLELHHSQAHQTMPLFELFQGHHDRLYSRLFSS